MPQIFKVQGRLSGDYFVDGDMKFQKPHIPASVEECHNEQQDFSGHDTVEVGGTSDDILGGEVRREGPQP